MTGRTEATTHGHIRRLSICLVLVLVVWAVIVVRLVLIQVVHGPRLAAYAARQQTMTVELAPERGTIYDRNLEQLAANLDVHSVCARPHSVEAPRETARALARVLGGSRHEYERLLSKDAGFVWIERQIAPDRAAAVEALGIDGLELLPETKRVYPHGDRACHVIGFTDIDGHGISGIEQHMDERLRGTPATVQYHIDGAQRKSPAPSGSLVAPEDGESIVLTIDAALQEICEVEIEKAVREHEARSGTVVIQDPWTGEILAMANYPRFDCNAFARYAEASWRNRAVTDQFEPGSTFKVVTACAAVETHAADEASVYYASQGAMRFGSFTIRDVKPHGWMTFRTALIKSSNICFAQIGEALGDFALYQYARAFGFGCLTAINLPGEVRGTLKHPSEWSRRSVHTIAIGQEVAVTALQLVGAYSAIANGGHLMEPHIVKAVVSEEGRVLEEAQPCVVRQVVSADVASYVREVLTDVTTVGTGRKAVVAEFSVAGKTGTAQKVVPGTPGYAPGKFVSSFAGFAPADDPGMVILVVVDEPKGRGLGGDVAAPVFRRIVERVVRSTSHHLVTGRRKSVPERLITAQVGRDASTGHATAGDVRDEGAFSGGTSGVVLAESPGRGMSSRAALGDGVRGTLVMSAALAADGTGSPDGDGGDVSVAMPDLIGMSVRAARREAALLGLVVTFEGSGLVRSQSPRRGASVEPGDRVRLECR